MHVAACGREALNPLVASYGRSLVDRAALDALLKLNGVSFFQGMRANIGGLAPHAVVPDLAGFDFSALLAALRPARRIHARHTVGLVDPITAADQAERVGDGLPETLEEVAATYGHRFWKLKVMGDVRQDVDRLCRIAAVIDGNGRLPRLARRQRAIRRCRGRLELWRAMAAEPRLRRLCDAVLYIEQPVKRARALETGMAALARARPVIIDESDGALDAFVQARGLGYTGVSSKACKGVWRSLLNRARCEAWNAESDEVDYFMSGEDLTTLAGVCVQQDLALVALLGLTHVERNGHHFIDGFNGRPKAEAVRFMEAHPTFTRIRRAGRGWRSASGVLELGSLAVPGLGASGGAGLRGDGGDAEGGVAARLKQVDHQPGRQLPQPLAQPAPAPRRQITGLALAKSRASSRLQRLRRILAQHDGVDLVVPGDAAAVEISRSRSPTRRHPPPPACGAAPLPGPRGSRRRPPAGRHRRRAARPAPARCRSRSAAAAAP